MTHILIADDHPIVVKGIQEILKDDLPLITTDVESNITSVMLSQNILLPEDEQDYSIEIFPASIIPLLL